MKRIEPGCLVLILKAEDASIVGKCGIAVGKYDGMFSPVGEDKPVYVNGWWDVDIGDEFLACRPESSLMRIDGSDGEKVDIESETEVDACYI